MQNYTIRNKKLSPIHRLEFGFLKRLYWYLTKQKTDLEFKDNLYKNYTDIVNLSYFPNREDQNPKMQETVYLQSKIILEDEYQGPRSFILLNNSIHYNKMQQTIDLIYRWGINPEYHGYASEKEFWETMEFLRTQFNENKIDMYAAVGKWPRKFRTRFKRQ